MLAGRRSATCHGLVRRCDGGPGAMRRALLGRLALLALVVASAACTASRPATDQGASSASPDTPTRPPTKRLVIGYGRAVPHIGPMEGGVAEFREIAQAGLLAL